MAAPDRRGEILGLFGEWIVPYSKATAALERLQMLRGRRQTTRWDTEQKGAYILAPAHSGKSHVVNKMLFSKVVIPELRASGLFAPDVSDGHIKRLQKKVIYAKMSQKPLYSDFTMMLLRMYGDPFWARKEKPSVQLLRAGDLREHHATELVIFDRFDQLTKLTLDKETMVQASLIQDAVKNMIEDGWPIVVVGLPNARNAVNNMQNLVRMAKIDLMPMRFKYDLEEFHRFLAGLELLLLENGIFDQQSGIFENYHALRLYYASQGRLGVLCNIICEASILAYGSRRIETRHIRASVETMARNIGICKINPYDERDDSQITALCKTRIAKDEVQYGPEYFEYFQ